MPRITKAAPIAITLLLLAGCDAGPGPVAPQPERTVPAAQASAAAGQHLARAFALALRSADLRAGLRDAMRDAPYNEHKLVLQDFVATPEGQALVAGAAAAAGTTVGEVDAWIGQLPPMDFYMPLPEHRRTWRATDDLVVGLNLNVDDTRLTGYAPDGTVHQLDRHDGLPTLAVIIMHPAEPKYVRASSLPGSPELIEPQAVHTAAYIAPCPDCGGGGFTPVLYQFRPYVGDGWGDLEIMFKHYNGAGTKVWEWITSGVNRYDLRQPNISTVMGSRVAVWERDSGFPEVSGDDPMGEATPAPSGQVTALYAACGPLNDDSGQVYANCVNQYGVNPALSEAEIWYTPVHTIDITYRY